MCLKKASTKARVYGLMVLGVLSVAVLTAAPALALPEGRVYEMVSPPYKAGYDTSHIDAAAPNGESVAFASGGVFAGSDAPQVESDYLARRGGSGWVTAPLDAPASLAPASKVEDISSTLETVLSVVQVAPNVGEIRQSNENEYLMHRTGLPDSAANWEVAGGLVIEAIRPPGSTINLITSEVGGSANLCHLLVQPSGLPLTPEGSETIERQVYQLSACDGEPGLRLLGLDNQGKALAPGCALPGAEGSASGREGAFNAISADGSETFFNAATASGGKTTCQATDGVQVFVRLGGSRTVEVSRPLDVSKPFGGCGDGGAGGETPGEVPCPGASARPSAEFDGASEDGSRVFFTTTAPLTGGGGEAGKDLYMASIGCVGEGVCEASERQVTALVRVSAAADVGEAAEVQNVVRVAPGGSRVYFVARGVLVDAPNPAGISPVKGADNLYVYDAESHGLAFVADLCSDAAQSGVVEDARCPRDLSEGRNDKALWSGNAEAQSTSDGRFLVFSTYAQLVTRGREADTDTARDVYRYDALTGALNRVSLGEAGFDANGNGVEPSLGAYDASIQPGDVRGAKAHETHELSVRAISEDGSRIVFSSTEPLSPADHSGSENVYEWHQAVSGEEGVVSLVSGGAAETSAHSPVITPSGNDVFFVTTQGLVPDDTDGQADVYDARLGGGFAPAPTAVAPCAGDACQGSLTNPAPLLVPGSVSQAPGGNFAPAVVAPATIVKAKAKAAPKCGRGYVRRNDKCVKSGKRAKRSARRRK
jgi:hypothetical protein